MKHQWEPTDNQGRSMECPACGKAIYIEEQQRWDREIDADCPGPVHPGEILLHEFLIASDETVAHLAEATGVSTDELLAIVREEAPITEEVATALALHYETSQAFWLNLQARYDEQVR